jgi:hypothetical protein
MFSFWDIESDLHFIPVLDVAMFKDVCYEMQQKNLMTMFIQL